ncbi:tRNA (N6-threonylcarbamoyladenosine(37)-N6)-methyltransferase TrmO [Methanobacterium sp. MBAC-LM]|uniref:tRNA (N6-threonylcarbamoyladenosine(37)-N6)-methyltransferase TrmO n=1 Tax=Methanobacterium sp. MBAC-LM TaxID=3412034 RepID=UPI003C72D6E5
MKLKAIGTINSPYKVKGDSPRQGRFSEKLSKITVFDEYAQGLQDVEKREYLIILYGLDRAEDYKLMVIPPGKTKEQGLFSTRAPVRPNPIALCMVKLIKVEENVLTVKWLDALDGSPLLDIKPFLPEVDCTQK